MTSEDGIEIQTDEFESAGWWGVCTSKHEGDTSHMTMYFRNTVITEKFIALCKQKGYHGRTKLDGGKYVVTVDVPKKDHPGFVATWASVSMEGAPKQAFKPNTNYMATLTDDSPMPFGKYGPKSKDPRPLKKVPAGYLLWLWEGTSGPELYKQTGGVADYIRTNFSAIEKDAPDFIVEQRPDVPR